MDKPKCKKCEGSGIIEAEADRRGIDANDERCELCNGTGYFKSNTAEFEGDCPNGCKGEANEN